MICRRCFFSTPTRQMSWHHLDTSSVENYWWFINSPCVIHNSLLSISLSILQTFHLLNLSHSLQTSSLRILKLSSSISSLGKLLIYFIYMHFMSWNLGFGFFFFFFFNFWGFSKLKKYCWNFGLVFEDLILQTSCIALHLHYNIIIMYLNVCNLFVCW